VAVEVEDRAAAAAEVPRPALPRHARLQALRPAHQNAHVRRAAGALREHRELRFEVWPAPVPGSYLSIKSNELGSDTVQKNKKK